MTRFACLGVVVACLPAAGCGTSAHRFCGPVQRDDETGGCVAYPRYYGGVWTDRQMIREGHYALILDLPFSFAADSFLAALDLVSPRRKRPRPDATPTADPAVTAVPGSAGPGPAGTSAGR